jgi:hypothetical protein
VRITVLLVAATVVLVAACSSSADRSGRSTTAGTTPSTVAEPRTEPVSTSTIDDSTSTTTLVSTTAVATTATTLVATTTVTTTVESGTTPYAVPLADVAGAGWGGTHAGYPATDVFIACGAEIVAPVNGATVHVRTVDTWDPAVDDPATRGGRSVAVLGDDGVRYYVAHLDEVDPAVAVGQRVTVGQRLGTVGRTGRSSACHVHFGISPPCPGPEWSVRRGVIDPARYLDAWRAGEQVSPASEVSQWLADNPTACADAMNDPHAAGAAPDQPARAILSAESRASPSHR